MGSQRSQAAAERRAEDTAREVMQKYGEATREPPPAPTARGPNLAGLDDDVQPGDREPEEKL